MAESFVKRTRGWLRTGCPTRRGGLSRDLRFCAEHRVGLFADGTRAEAAQMGSRWLDPMWSALAGGCERGAPLGAQASLVISAFVPSTEWGCFRLRQGYGGPAVVL